MSPRPISPGRRRPYGGTQAVRRAIAILKAFSPDRAEWSLADLAVRVGLNKTTVFRLLDALEHEGMVTRDPRQGTFRLGPEIIALGSQAIRSMDLYGAAHTELEDLARDTGETASLEILAGEDVVTLDEVPGRHLMGSSSEIGMRWPIHATSTGKVLLAFSKDEGKSLLARRRLTRYTAKTIQSIAALERELEQVRKQGYATAVDELEIGFVAIGAPIKNHLGQTIASVSIGGPTIRLNRKRIVELAERVQLAGHRISQKMGGPGA